MKRILIAVLVSLNARAAEHLPQNSCKYWLNALDDVASSEIALRCARENGSRLKVWLAARRVKRSQLRIQYDALNEWYGEAEPGVFDHIPREPKPGQPQFKNEPRWKW